MKLSNTHPLLNAEHNFPRNSALITRDEQFSYSQLLTNAKVILRDLIQLGIKPGDIVILDLLTPTALITTLWACSLGSFTAFPWNTRFPVDLLKTIYDRINPAIIISTRKIGFSTTFTFDETGQDSLIFSESQLSEFDPKTPATLIMSSGSTGSSKLVMHSLLNHLSSAAGSNLNIPLLANDRWLLSLPLYHVGGLSIIFRAALVGAAVVIPDSQNTFLEDISRNQVTHISLVPTQLQRLMNTSEFENVLSRMKAILLGGSPIPRHLILDSVYHGLPIYLSYGSTEMASQITTSSARDLSVGLSHSGRLLQGRDLIIAPTGEILVRGDTLAMGYLKGSRLMPLDDANGWFHTGDIGYTDVSGALTVTGRIDNQFISGGENIQPEQIESALNNIEGIEQAVVVAQEDPEFGARPIALLLTKYPSLKKQSIASELKRSLPGYMVPVAFFHLPKELINDQLKFSRKAVSNFVTAGNKPLHSLL